MQLILTESICFVYKVLVTDLVMLLGQNTIFCSKSARH